MKKIYILTVLLSFILSSKAQDVNLKWAKSIGSSTNDVGYSITVDSLGSVYVTGYFTGTADFDPGPGTTNLTSVGGADIFILKLDSIGSLVWVKQIGGKTSDFSNSIKIGNSNSIYITGSFTDTADFDTGSGSYKLYSSGGEDAFILKLNNQGNLVWVKQFGGVSNEAGKSLALDIFENIYTMGYFGSTVDFDAGTLTFNLTSISPNDNFVLKMDSTGSFSWVKQFGGNTTNNACSIALDIAGNVYATGSFAGTVDFDPGIPTFNLSTGCSGSGCSDIFVIKLNISGNFGWAFRIGQPNGDDRGFSIALGSSGNVYCTGYFSGKADFDPGSGSDTLTAQSGDIFILKIDGSGNYIWAKQVGGPSSILNFGNSIAVDVAENIYITGYFRSTVDFDPGIGVYNLISSGKRDIFVAKLTQSGNFVWAKQMAGSIQDERGESICVDHKDNVYITGAFTNTVDFNPEIGIHNLASSGADDIFVQKISQNSKIWPGDTNNDSLVDNTDLLPIGMHYAQTGSPRASNSNAWQSYICENWGKKQSNCFDINHVDCNGDGTINSNDTLAVNLNFNLTHAIVPNQNYSKERQIAPEIYFVSSSNSYSAGDWVDVEVWAGNSILPVSDLYGIAFNINYDASLVQPGTETITYPSSWLGTPGTNAIKIGKIDALATTAYGAVTRIDHVNANGYGKIADFNFQINTSLVTEDTLHLSFSDYRANNSGGNAIVLKTKTNSILINQLSTGIEQQNVLKASVYPNPFTQETTISFNKNIENSTLKIVDIIGKEVRNINFSGRQLTFEKEELQAGIYFITIASKDGLFNTQKIIIQ